MTWKFTVTQEQADAIKWVKEQIQYQTLSVFVEEHVRTLDQNSYWLGEASSLSGIHTDNLIRALYLDDYEIKSEYKVGEWVVFVTVTGDSYVGKVEGVEGGGILRTDIYAKAEVKQWFDGDSLRYATPEEIKAEKERRVWVKTGREVGEFKIDDVYRLKKYPHINIYIRNEEGLTNAEENHMNGAILGFYPAESFIGFECE